MKRKSNPELVDADNPEWTTAEARKASSFSALPKTLQTKLARRTVCAHQRAHHDSAFA